MTTVSLPEGLLQYAGRICDLDSHEMLPAQAWVETYGTVATELADVFLTQQETDEFNKNHPNVPDFAGDTRPVDPASVWLQKGCKAPGAMDIARRLEVMDAMGVGRQLMFPTGLGLFGLVLAVMPQENLYHCMGNIGGDRRAKGKELLKAYNEWGLRVGRISDRVRPALPLLAETVDELMESARYLLGNGARALFLPSSIPPGGRSPAHPDLDPFWQMVTDANAVICLHIGGEGGTFLDTPEWGNSPVFENFRSLGEFRVDPWALSVQHLPTQNLLATAIVGGVFDRHPDLRFAAVETGAGWIGPLLENLDVWNAMGKAFGTKDSFKLPEKPSFYIRRNVRVTPFDFEPIDRYIEWYGLEDVLCFASDYPHVEGGTNPAGAMYDRIARLGPDVVEKFFVTNGQWLLPE